MTKKAALALCLGLGLVSAVAARAESGETPTAVEGADQQPTAEAGAAGTATAATADPISKSFRIGFWEIDLFAVDHEPRGDTFRLLDFRIFRLLEIGQGPDYQAFSLFEMPGLLNLFTSRRDGAASELRLLDLQAISLAMVRQVQEGEGSYSRSFVKLPVLGSVVSFEANEDAPNVERQTTAFLFRRDVPR